MKSNIVNLSLKVLFGTLAAWRQQGSEFKPAIWQETFRFWGR